MSSRPVVHMSSAYHRSADWLHNAATGGWCDRESCDSPDHVAPYAFFCRNPHCTNPAHTATDADIGQLQSTQDWLTDGRSDAVVTADDWRQDLNWYAREAWDELPRDDEEEES